MSIGIIVGCFPVHAKIFGYVGFKVREELSLRLKSADNPNYGSRVGNDPYAQAHGAERAARTAAPRSYNDRRGICVRTGRFGITGTLIP